MPKLRCCLVLVSLCILMVSCDDIENDLDEDIPENATIVEKWIMIEKKVKKGVNSAINALLPKIMENSGEVVISPQCMKQGMQLIAGIRNIEPWALRFLDSSAKVMDGLFVGTLASFGVYDECLNTVAPNRQSKNKDEILFRGKYCTIEMKPPIPPVKKLPKLNHVLPEFRNLTDNNSPLNFVAKYAHLFKLVSLRFGVCVPSGCTVGDLDQIAKSMVKKLGFSANATRCEVKHENEFSTLLICVLSAFSFMGLLSAIGTLADLYFHYTNTHFDNVPFRLVQSFSVMSNFRKLVDTKTSKHALSCLNGIRFLSITWVVLGHTYLLIDYHMFVGIEKIQNYAKDFAFQAILNGSFAVDTFFCIGGLLICYITVKMVKLEGRTFNLTDYISHRIFRILPVYVFVILSTFMSGLLGSGPMFHDLVDKFSEPCYTNWWRNLLFISNFYSADETCLAHSWYVAADFQLYLAAVTILIPLLRNTTVGLVLCFLSIISSIIYSGVVTYIYDYPPTMLFVNTDPNALTQFFKSFYFHPMIHCSSYCIGMLSGYLLITKPNLKITRPLLYSGWALAFASAFSTLYGVYEWNKGTEPTFTETLLYASLSRTAWSMSIAWMIVCCATGHGGVVNYILSWKAFIPLGRLSFIVYLIHPSTNVGFYSNIRTRLQPDHFIAIWIFLAGLCVNFMIAFIGSLIIEAPLISVEKALRGGTRTDSPEKNNFFNETLASVQKNVDITSKHVEDTNENMCDRCIESATRISEKSRF